MENELDTALHIEVVNTLGRALQVEFEASVEMPTGKMQDLQSPPTAQEEVHRSPFRKMFQPSEKVELNGLLGVGCFQGVDEKDAPKGRKVVGVSMGAHIQRRWTWKLLENKIQRGCERIHSCPGCRLL